MLDRILNLEVWQFIMVFARVGAAVTMLPGLGSSIVNTRARGAMALALVVLITPLVGPTIPHQPREVFQLTWLVFREVTIGVFIGCIPTLMIAALDLAGNNIGMAVGFSNAMLFDPATNNQSQLVSGLLNMIALTIIFATNLDHLMLQAIVDSYSLFKPGDVLPVQDFSSFLAQKLGRSFLIGVQLASPFVVFAILLNSGMGILSRLLPQLNIFFLTMPLQLYLGVALMMITIPVIMQWFLRYFEDGLISFMNPV